MESVILVSSHLLFLLIGAGLTLWCSHLLRGDQRLGSSAREQAARRLALLEEVALQAAAVHQLFQKLESLADESARAGGNLAGTRQQELESTRQELTAAFDDLPLAEAKLRLVDEPGLSKLLRLYSTRVAAFDKVCSGRVIASEEELNKRKKEIHDLREKFLSALADRYGRPLR